MAQQVKTVLVDDLTGEPATETVQFGVDGRHYELDLTKDNAK
ncbi:histone-like nucleoid-structuring protein Lsr2, partial [uncultured Citricoccus sp.]